MMKRLLIALCIVAATAAGYGIHTLESAFDPHYFRVRAIDVSDCSMKSVALHLEDRVISIGNSQIDREYPQIGEAEGWILVLKTSDKMDYHMVVKFKRCPTLRSEVRTYERGNIIYEFIEKDNITQEVRA